MNRDDLNLGCTFPFTNGSPDDDHDLPLFSHLMKSRLGFSKQPYHSCHTTHMSLAVDKASSPTRAI